MPIFWIAYPRWVSRSSIPFAKKAQVQPPLPWEYFHITLVFPGDVSDLALQELHYKPQTKQIVLPKVSIQDFDFGGAKARFIWAAVAILALEIIRGECGTFLAGFEPYSSSGGSSRPLGSTSSAVTQPATKPPKCASQASNRPIAK